MCVPAGATGFPITITTMARGDEHMPVDGDRHQEKWVCYIEGGLCYNHVQLRVLSGHSSRIAALQLNSGRSSLALVTVMQISFH